MKFLHVTLYVSNLEASLAFYRDIVGLELHRRITVAPGLELAFLGEGEGGTEVELICDPHKEKPRLAGDVSIGFAAGCVDTLRARLLEQGMPGVGEMISVGPATKFFFVPDPDGMPVQFMQS